MSSSHSPLDLSSSISNHYHWDGLQIFNGDHREDELEIYFYITVEGQIQHPLRCRQIDKFNCKCQNS